VESSGADSSAARQVTEQEKQELTDVLTRAGLLHFRDNFIHEKVLACCLGVKRY